MSTVRLTLCEDEELLNGLMIRGCGEPFDLTTQRGACPHVRRPQSEVDAWDVVRHPGKTHEHPELNGVRHNHSLDSLHTFHRHPIVEERLSSSGKVARGDGA
jgi:hypothetical protein